MRQNSTDKLFNANLGLMCAVNFLMCASVYMMLAVLPLALADKATAIYPAFIAGMVAVGPLHAYLADALKRKHVLLFSVAGIALTMAAASHATEAWYCWVALLQGGCFALATGAGTTISIDITPSGHRTGGNMFFALCGRIGMVTGMMLGVWAFTACPSAQLFYIAVALNGIALLLAAWVYVSFRAPIGVRLFSLDRFLLARAWLPAINVGILAFAFGMASVFLTNRSVENGIVWMLPLLLLPLITPPLVKMFVKLSHHCQRATGNMTFNLLLDIGMVGGIWTVCGTNDGNEVCKLGIGLLLLALLMFVFVTRSYYKKKRVR